METSELLAVMPRYCNCAGCGKLIGGLHTDISRLPAHLIPERELVTPREADQYRDGIWYLNVVARARHFKFSHERPVCPGCLVAVLQDEEEQAA